MKFILPVLIATILLCLFLFIPGQEQPTENQILSTPEANTSAQHAPEESVNLGTTPEQVSTDEIVHPAPVATEAAETTETKLESQQPEPVENENQLTFNLDQSTHFLILGNADSEHGKMNFKSELLPSNEVQLSIQLQQQDSDKIELKAYFDLANFTMELDGGNSVLNKEHKKLLKQTGESLQSAIWDQYSEYDIPEHALMLAQMLAYWSVSPEGFVHEKRVIVSQ